MDLGTLNEGIDNIWALGINFDGLVIVGHAYDKSVQRQRAFRWTCERGIEFLGDLNGERDDTTQNYAWSVNSDGSVIVGADDGVAGGSRRGFRWTREEGMQSLGTLGGSSEAHGVSADGSVIVGNSRDGAVQDQQRAFRWTVEEGMQSLGTLNDDINSIAYAVSADGSVVVGTANHQWRAFRWTQEKGMEFAL